MAITAADIQNQSFSIDRKGYDVDEVDVFLEHVADEIDALNRQIASLENQLDNAAYDNYEATQIIAPAEPAVDYASQDAALAEKDAIIADLQHQLEEKKANDNAIAQALIIAQRSADEILANANNQAADTIADAREEAQRIVDRANADKQSVLDAIRKLEDDREDAREQYQDLLKNFISDASRKLADIGGLNPSANAPRVATPVTSAHAAPSSQADVTGAFSAAEVIEAATVNYTTPQAAAVETVVAAPTPVASSVEKDLSGFGDVDDSFEFDEID